MAKVEYPNGTVRLSKCGILARHPLWAKVIYSAEQKMLHSQLRENKVGRRPPQTTSLVGSASVALSLLLTTDGLSVCLSGNAIVRSRLPGSVDNSKMDRQNHTKNASPELTIETAVDKFIARKRPNWSGSSPRSYRKSLATFQNFAKDEDVEDTGELSRWKVGEYTDWLLEKDYELITVQGKQKKARTWLKWMESQDLVEVGTHLAIDVLKLDDEDQTSADILRPTEIQNYLKYYRNSTKWHGTRRHALLEVVGHVGARRLGVRALDIEDWDYSERTLRFLDRPDQGTKLKCGKRHERKVILSQKPANVLHEYVVRERYKKNDKRGRKPLFTSRQGRPSCSTITNWMYRATQPCIMRDCPHSRERHNCEWTNQTKASQCPSSESPHPVRRGSITWQLNIGRSLEDVADRAGTTPGVVRRYYDRPDLDEDLQRRITKFDEIDLCEHQQPDDVDGDMRG